MARKAISEPEVIDLSVAPEADSAADAKDESKSKMPREDKSKMSPKPSLSRWRTRGHVSYMSQGGRRDVGPGTVLEDLPDEDAAKMVARGSISPC